MYENQINLNMNASGNKLEGSFSIIKTKQNSLNDIDENDIDVEEDGEMHPRIEVIFGRKITIALIAADWKYKEMAVKYVAKQTEKMLSKTNASPLDLIGIVEAAACTVAVTCREKVMKVFNSSLSLFNILVSSTKI